MRKIVIIDDENRTRELIARMIDSFGFDVVTIPEGENVQSGIDAIEKHQPDIVFLDIQMPDGTGFDVIRSIENKTFEVIFITAHEEFAIKAIKFSALDYLLKPINYIDLVATVKNYDAKQNKVAHLTKLQVLLENLATGNSEFNKIAIPTENGFELIKPNSIMYCEADSNYCKLYLLNGKSLIVSKTLKHIEKLLPKAIFFRIHKTYLVNLNYAVRFNKTNELLVELSNGQKLPVSVRKKEEFIHAIVQKK